MFFPPRTVETSRGPSDAGIWVKPSGTFSRSGSLAGAASGACASSSSCSELLLAADSSSDMRAARLNARGTRARTHSPPDPPRGEALPCPSADGRRLLAARRQRGREPRRAAARAAGAHQGDTAGGSALRRAPGRPAPGVSRTALSAMAGAAVRCAAARPPPRQGSLRAAHHPLPRAQSAQADQRQCHYRSKGRPDRGGRSEGAGTEGLASVGAGFADRGHF